VNTPTFPVHEVWHLTASSWKNKIEDANAVDVFILKEIRVPMMSCENLRRWWIACVEDVSRYPSCVEDVSRYV